MKTIKRKQSNLRTKNIVAVKVMAFLSWLIYIGIAFANDMLIEAFVISIGLVIVSYFVFGRKTAQKQSTSTAIIDAQKVNESSPSQNYLSVFFHSSHQVGQLNKSNAMK